MWSMILTSVGSLYFAGFTDIQTADQAASALEPLVKSFPNSGQIAKFISHLVSLVQDYLPYLFYLHPQHLHYQILLAGKRSWKKSSVKQNHFT